MEEHSRIYLSAIFRVFEERPNKDSLLESTVIGEALTYIINQRNPRIDADLFYAIYESRISLIRKFVNEDLLGYIPGSFKSGAPSLKLSHSH